VAQNDFRQSRDEETRSDSATIRGLGGKKAAMYIIEGIVLVGRDGLTALGYLTVTMIKLRFKPTYSRP